MMYFVGAFLTVLFVMWLVPREEFPKRALLVAYAYSLYAFVGSVSGLLF